MIELDASVQATGMPQMYILRQDHDDGDWQSFIFAASEPDYYSEITMRSRAKLFASEEEANAFMKGRLFADKWHVEAF